MKTVIEWYREMDTYERKEFVEGIIGFGSLFVIVFMLAVIGG